MGTGKYTRANPEQCWILRKGKGLRVRDHGVPRLIVSPRREHSRKPDEARSGLERLFGDVRRIELFARERAKGWKSWGNQVPQPADEPVDNSPAGAVMPAPLAL
jgi:N6-adenosine-specific RNA methylase IME4